MEVVTIAEMREIEKEGFAAGTSYEAMVEMVGRDIAELILDCIGEKNFTVTGLIGKGNNGADTIVALRHIAKSGLPVNVIFTADRGGDAYEEEATQIAKKVFRYDRDGLSYEIKELLQASQIILDGIYGIGFHPPLPDSLRPLLQTINQSKPKLNVVSVDCASGIDCDSGHADPDAVQAGTTISVHRIKSGQLIGDAAVKSGQICPIRMKLAPNLPVYSRIKRQMITVDLIHSLLPERPNISNKGSFGTVRIFGGCENYLGAPLLSAKASYAVGAGLVEINSTETVRNTMASSLMEAIWNVFPSDLNVQSWVAGRLPDKARSAWLIGPGMSAAAAKLFHGALTDLTARNAVFPPLVLDATILNCLSNDSRQLPTGTILTPHPGEMARMIDVSVSDVQSSRIEVAEAFSRQTGAVVVLKGAYTVISAPSGQTWVSPFANSALAKAGSGDVLAGTIAGFAAQLQDPVAASILGVWFHGEAAEKYRSTQHDTRALNPSTIPDDYANVFAELSPDQHSFKHMR